MRVRRLPRPLQAYQLQGPPADSKTLRRLLDENRRQKGSCVVALSERLFFEERLRANRRRAVLIDLARATVVSARDFHLFAEKGSEVAMSQEFNCPAPSPAVVPSPCRDNCGGDPGGALLTLPQVLPEPHAGPADLENEPTNRPLAVPISRSTDGGS